MNAVLLEVNGLSKRFGGFMALGGISLTVRAGERLGLIGPNGSGKSTLVNCVGGTLRHDAGRVCLDGHVLDGLPAHRRVRLGLARTFQLIFRFHLVGSRLAIDQRIVEELSLSMAVQGPNVIAST